MTSIGLAELVAHAYEVACDMDGLDEWVGRLADYFGDVESALIIWPLRDPDELVLVTHGISSDALREQFEQRSNADSLFGRIAALPAGETCFVDDAFGATPPRPDEESSHSKLHALIGTVIVDEVHRCCLTLFRDANRGEFSQLENDTLRTLTGYFQRAVILNRRFIEITGREKTMGAVLDSAPRGIVTVGQNGQITYINVEGQRILAQADGVSLTNNTINFRDGKLRDKYSAFIKFACQESETPWKQERMNAIINRTSATTPYQLMAYTLPVDKRQALLFQNEALAVLIIQDATTNLQLRSELLQTFYNLSAAEARLAVALYRGRTLPEAASELHISVNTARSQLRGIFKKVGVNSQAMLLQALASGVKDVTQNSYISSVN